MDQYRGRPVIWQTEEHDSRGPVSRAACHLADRGTRQSWTSTEGGLSSGRQRNTTVVDQYRGRPVIWQTEEHDSRGPVPRAACHLADRGTRQSWTSIEGGLSSGRQRNTTVVDQYRGRPVIWQTEEHDSRGPVPRAACHLADRGTRQSWTSTEGGLSSGRQRNTTVVDQYRGRPVIWQAEGDYSGAVHIVELLCNPIRQCKSRPHWQQRNKERLLN